MQDKAFRKSDVARMELGEHNPSVERLIRISGGLDIELMIDIRPKGRVAKLPGKRALEGSSVTSGDCEIVFALA
jgi:transcriptional regulator with XRE-family HTH domain